MVQESLWPQSMRSTTPWDHGIVITFWWLGIMYKEYVSVSIDICPWQNPMQFGIKLKVTPCDTPGRVKLLDKEEINTSWKTSECSAKQASWKLNLQHILSAMRKKKYYNGNPIYRLLVFYVRKCICIISLIYEMACFMTETHPEKPQTALKFSLDSFHVWLIIINSNRLKAGPQTEGMKDLCSRT